MKKCRLIFLLVCTLWHAPSVNAQNVVSLSELTWKNRILLAHPATQKELDALWDRLNAAEKNVQERQLQVLATWRNQVKSYPPVNAKIDPVDLMRLLTEQGASYVLIGLDGGIKFKTNQLPPTLEPIFSLIDSMPMRRAELH